ncbi:uncharacterized protein [Antedon mediterranea]|uniref:uncharacterized protein n=1 Tax=Antedon mediterranea TaxID=105859 RepID=UPI003AF7E1EF
MDFNQHLPTLVILIIINSAILCSSLQCTPKQDILMVNNSSDCFRECEFPAKPRLCEFEFTVTWWYTLAAACTDCPDVRQDCSAYRCYSVDGSRRPILTVNEMSPGPSIQICHGDTIRVKVNNELQDGGSLTIHWHGIHQFNTVWADGVPMITQCPIPSSTSFVYEFVADPPGTHWWHSHVGVQRGDGLYGALIVREPRQKEFNSKEYDFDLPQHYMLFNDWLSIPSITISMVSIANGVPSEHSLSLLINGRSHNYDIDIDVPVSVFEVEQGFRYRMRIVNTALGECNMRLVIESHPITIIATDGFEVKPIRVVDALSFTPGERLDFVLEASAIPSSYCIYIISSNYDLCSASGSAVLQYKNTPAVKLNCSVEPPSHIVFTTEGFDAATSNGDVTLKDTHALQSVDPALHKVDLRYYVVIDYQLKFYTSTNPEVNQTYSSVYRMNKVKFEFPHTPFVSLQQDDDVSACEMTPWNIAMHIDAQYCKPLNVSTDFDIACKCPIVAKAKLGQVIEFIVINEISVYSHPMHLHGQSFRVLAQDRSTEHVSPTDLIDQDKTEGLPRIPLVSAVVKDTVNVPDFGYVIIRWKAENPGYWFFHCHVEYHATLGMAMVVQVGDEDEIPDPPKAFPSCSSWSPDL